MSSISVSVGGLGIRKRIDVLSKFDTSTTVEYLRQLNRSERETILELLDEETKTEIKLISSFDEDEIGSKMTTNFISIHSGVGVRQAMRELISQSAENDNISTIYAVDEDEVFVGAIDLKDLIIARAETALDSITTTSFPYV